MSRKKKQTDSSADSKKKAISRLKNGQTSHAEQLLRKCCRTGCTDPEIWYYLGLIEASTQRIEAAVISLQTCLKYAPSSIQAINGLASLYSAQGQLQKAAQCYLKITRLDPDGAEAHYNLGVVLQEKFELEEAVDCYGKALALKPDWVEANNNLAYTLYNLGELDKAYDLFQRALQLRPNYEPSIAGAASIMGKRKQYKEVYKLIKPLLESGNASCGIMLVYSSVCHYVDRCEDAIHRLEGMVISKRSPPNERCKMHFELTKLYDKKGLYDKAFAHASVANKLKNINFNRQAFSSMIDAMFSVFGKNYSEIMPDSGCQSERPIFIVGLPRSGTSLVEQIIATHPDVYGAGELNDIPQITTLIPGLSNNRITYPECIKHLERSQLSELSIRYNKRLQGLDESAKRVTDKLPLNFLNLGLISLLFPRARVIHCKRDPMDTCLSCFFNDFTGVHEFAYDLEDLGFYYTEYLRLMIHWKETLEISITDIQYETLIGEPEKTIRKIIEACGLAWDSQCLSYYDSGRYIHTISHEDVTRPLYDSAIGRWVNYKKYLKPLQEALQYA